MLAVRAVAWILAAYPGTHIALTGFSRALLVEFLAEVKDITRLAAYQRIFRGVCPRAGMDRADMCVFTNGSSVVVRSSGSKLTGRRADWLIIDDPHAGRAEAESAIQRRKVIQWFFADCMTRLSPDAKIMLIGTRWHPHDLIGHLTSDEYRQQLIDEGQEHQVFDRIVYEAVASGRADDPLGRSEGEPLAPEIRPLSFLQGMRASLLGYEWDSLFQQTPRSSASGQVDLNQLRRCDASQVPAGLAETRGWDLALTETQTSDYTSGARLAIDRETDTLYLTDMFRQRMVWARVENAIVRTSLEDLESRGIARVGVEAVGGFQSGMSTLQQKLAGRVAVHARNPKSKSKLMRASPWLAKIAAGKFVMVRGPWNKDFISELEQFPDGDHDDQVDAISIAYEELKASRLLLA
jgi:predicted phage terminase large subunit-like protein